jgi:hypothetical protein
LVATLKLANQIANDGIGTAKVNGTPPDKGTLLADDAVWALTFLFHQHGRADLLAESFGSDDDDPFLKSPTILPAVAAGRCLPPGAGHGGGLRSSSSQPKTHN